MECLGKIPETGDNFEYENLKVSILETDSHRVTLVEVVKTDNKETDKD